jgi:hypothetical protein
MKDRSMDDFRRGALAAADAADMYNSASTHEYRLGDLILAKLNLRKQNPRSNKQCVRSAEEDAWLVGVAIALAEVHRRLLQGNDSSSVRAVAKAVGLTRASARGAGVAAFDLRELKKAGVP